MPGETAKICFETPRSISTNEFLRIAFVPRDGMTTVNELYTPNLMILQNVHPYP
ncbi:MAG: hypothetical protein ACOCZ6_04240 [Nanoarchaeota archaeon]